MLSYHNEQESHDTCSTMQASVQLPIGGQELSCGHAHQTFPRRFGEYAAHTHFAASHSSQSDCHSLCPDTNVVANLLLSSAARLQSPQSLLRAILYHARSLLPQLPQAVRRLLQREYCFCWVWPNTVPPKRALLIAVSADCHLKSIQPSSAQSAMRAAQILSSRPHCVHR